LASSSDNAVATLAAGNGDAVVLATSARDVPETAETVVVAAAAAAAAAGYDSLKRDRVASLHSKTDEYVSLSTTKRQYEVAYKLLTK